MPRYAGRAPSKISLDQKASLKEKVKVEKFLNKSIIVWVINYNIEKS